MKHFRTGSVVGNFNESVSEPSLVSKPNSEAYLKAISERYPWFSLAHYLLITVSENHEKSWQHLFDRVPYKPYPTIILKEQIDNHKAFGTSEEDMFENAIEFFSNTTPSKVTLKPLEADTPEEDISIDSVAQDQELATETLAQIYLAQGHKEKAIEIYLKLSLKNPEKSAYFANLINKITSQ